MTNQELFDRVATHLLTQNAKCGVFETDVDEIEHQVFRCKYRDPEGHKCAIGALIPDKAYRPCFEGLGVGDAEIRRAAGLSDSQVDIGSALQETHDELEPGKWRAALLGVARDFGLSTEVIQ